MATLINSSLSANELDWIYSKFADSSLLSGDPILKNEDFNYLIQRGVTEEIIKDTKFFTMPSQIAFKKFIAETIKAGKGYMLSEVPGFYYDNNRNNWSHFDIKSIVIPMRNEFQEIIALQLRPIKPMPGGKYIWFSSKFAIGDVPNNKGLSHGTSSGAPLSIMYSSTSTDEIAITEGWFKGNKLRTLNLHAISAQGVYSINETILNTLSNMEKIQKTKFKKIKFFFDADYDCNLMVLKALAKAIDLLIDSYIVEIAYWDSSLGKGIDDYLENNDFSKVKFITANNFTLLSTVVAAECKKLGLQTKDKEDTKKVFNKYLPKFLN